MEKGEDVQKDPKRVHLVRKRGIMPITEIRSRIDEIAKSTYLGLSIIPMKLVLGTAGNENPVF